MGHHLNSSLVKRLYMFCGVPSHFQYSGHISLVLFQQCPVMSSTFLLIHCTVCSSLRRTKPSRGGRPRTQERRPDGEELHNPSFVPNLDPDPSLDHQSHHALPPPSTPSHPSSSHHIHPGYSWKVFVPTNEVSLIFQS